MKKILALMLGLGLAASAHANHDQDATKDPLHPCHKIRKACESAGYLEGNHDKNGKGLWVDCMAPLKKGKTVEGVSVSSSDLDACKAKTSEKKAEKHSK